MNVHKFLRAGFLSLQQQMQISERFSSPASDLLFPPYFQIVGEPLLLPTRCEYLCE